MNILILVATIFALHVDAIRLRYPKNYVKNTESSRIMGGQDAPEGFAPYQVSYQHEDRVHFCAGSIIDAKWILTAAHCIFNDKPSDIIIATGTNKWAYPNATYGVDAIFTHCRHNIPEYHNDIALLRLNTSIVFNEKTQPIALPTKPMKEGDEVILTGWGAPRPYGGLKDNLQMIKLKYVSHKKCKAMHDTKREGVDVGHICTFTKAGEGACYADSGGPLVSGGKLVGVVNWGIPCGMGYPDVHASPYFFTDWIRRVMSGNAKCN